MSGRGSDAGFLRVALEYSCCQLSFALCPPIPPTLYHALPYGIHIHGCLCFSAPESSSHTHNMKVEHFWMTQLTQLKPHAVKGTVHPGIQIFSYCSKGDMRVNYWWQNFYFWENGPFKCMGTATQAIRNGLFWPPLCNTGDCGSLQTVVIMQMELLDCFLDFFASQDRLLIGEGKRRRRG